MKQLPTIHLREILHRPRWILFVLIAGAIVSVVWQSYDLLPDKALPENVVAAKRLRVETATLNSVMQRLTAYRSASAN